MAEHTTETDADFSISLDDSIYDPRITNPFDVDDYMNHRIVHSLTTDTLDSVALGPSPSEENLQRLSDDVILDVDTVEELDDQTLLEEEGNNVNAVSPPTSIITPTGTDDNLTVPSLQSYFASTPIVNTDSFFDDMSKPIVDKEIEDESSSEFLVSFLSQNDGDDNVDTLFKSEHLSTDLEEYLRDEKDLEEDRDVEREYHRQIRTVSETEVVDFSCGNNTEQSQDAETMHTTDILTAKEDFEHFTAEGDEDEGLENLSISPRLNVFIPPPSRSRTSSECGSPLAIGHSPLTPLLTSHSVPQSPAHSALTTHKDNVTTPVVSSCASPIISQDPLSFLVFNDNTLSSPTEIDPFTASIQMSHKQRQFDAWFPCEATRQTLVAVVSSLPGPYTVPPEQLCFPAVAVNEPQSDPIRELLEKYVGEVEASKRDVLTVNSVTHDEKGLGQLIEAGCFWAAVDLTARLLTTAGQGVEPSTDGDCHTPSTLQLWLCRFTLHLRLNMYALADTEMKAFHNLDSPDLYYEYYPTVYPGRRGSMVPFALRLIHAELPHYMGRTQEALDHLYYILSVVRTILANLRSGNAEDGSEVQITTESRNASMELWERREIKTLYTIGNTLLAIKDYCAAISVYCELVDKDTPRSSDLHSGIGRVYLQMGNASMAKEWFEKAMTVKTLGSAAVNNLINQGLVCMCEAHYPDAWQHFSQAVATNPLNVVAINNLAVCALYMGRLKEALTSLENLIHQNPETNLHEGILFNLCTLYELESSRAMAKKQALLQLVSRYKGDGFPVTCLKMA